MQLLSCPFPAFTTAWISLWSAQPAAAPGPFPVSGDLAPCWDMDVTSGWGLCCSLSLFTLGLLSQPSQPFLGAFQHVSHCLGKGKNPPHNHDGFSQVQIAPGLWRRGFSVRNPSATWGFTGSAALAPTNTSPAGSNDELLQSSQLFPCSAPAVLPLSRPVDSQPCPE